MNKLQERIDTTLNAVRNCNATLANITPSSFNLASMTIRISPGYTLQSPLDVEAFKIRLATEPRLNITKIGTGGRKGHFQNALDIKLLRNGAHPYVLFFYQSMLAFNVAGCKLVEDAYLIVNVLLENLGLPTISVTDDSVCTINLIISNVDVNRGINLSALHSAVLSSFQHAQFDVGTGCYGVKIDMYTDNNRVANERTAVMVYSSGNIVFTGTRTPESLAFAYKNIVEFLDKHYSDLTFDLIPGVKRNRQKNPDAPPRKRGRKKKADTETFSLDDLTSLL